MADAAVKLQEKYLHEFSCRYFLFSAVYRSDRIVVY